MSKDNNNIVEKQQEESIGFKNIWNDLRKHKKLFYKVLPITFVLAAIYSLSLPDYYKCTVVLAPEMSGGRSGGSLGGIASSLGISLGSSNSGDAIMPVLYPALMNSITFHTSLFPIKVHREGDEREMTYYDYLLKEQKYPWWTNLKIAIMSFIFGGGNKNEEIPSNESINTFQLTKEQTAIERAIGGLVVCNVDDRSNVITINVTDQDPLIAATIADSVQQKLQKFITDYRTNKAQVNVKHYEALFAETKEQYEKALHDFAYFSDHNQKVLLQSVRSQQTKLENELALRQQAYTQAAAQLINANAKLQEEKPAFTILQPATVPIQKSAPSRAKICIVWMFLAFLGTTAYILHKEGHLMPLLGIEGGDEK